MSGWQIMATDTQPSKLYFEATLNVKKILMSKSNSHWKKKKFNIQKGADTMVLFSSKAVYFDTMESASLMITVKNLYKKQKSKIIIILEINSDPDSEESNIRKLRSSGVLDKLFQRDKRKPKSLKFQKFKSGSIYLGMILASIASILCGLSFVLKKRSLLQMDKREKYYQNKGWWMAHSLMMVGETLHFVAFFFAPAVLVCLLQMLMILVTAFASSSILGEKMNTYWKLAFATSLGGCLVIIVHVPREPHIYNIETFLYMVTAPMFAIYNLILFFITIIMMRFLIPKWGQINSLAFTVQSAIFGSIIVVALKGVLLVFTDKLFHWLPLTCVVIVGICLLLQFEYLNRALHSYNTLVVTTQYYVSYSALVIISLSLLFEVWNVSSEESIMIVLLGFFTTAMGVVIFAVFQEDDATFDFSKLFVGPDETG
ncbi:magnesium transporter NIPA2-like [Argiope bruennichi]|nr:magnesium transporter NIPA2-like [Argiope bruennichi]